MSRYDDESEYDDEFDPPEEADPVIRELRAEIVRLEAQLDQLSASVREQAEESVRIAARLSELEAALSRLRARQRKVTRLLVLAWLMVLLSFALSVYSFFTS